MDAFLKHIVSKRPNIYRLTHKLYAFANKKIFKAGWIIGIVLSLSSIILNWFIYSEIKPSSFTSIVVMLSLWIIYLILHATIQYAMSVSGIPGKFVFVGEYLKVPAKRRPCQLNFEGINKQRFEFVTESTVEKVSYLNAVAFKRGNWKDSYNAKYQRNLAHVRKNKLSMMLVKSLVENKCIGFTHIFPITEATWKEYLAGEIGDNDYPADEVCDLDILTKRTEFDKPYGIMLFSIANAFKDSEMRKSSDFKRLIGDIYEQAAVYHVSHLLQTAFIKSEIVPIMFQNMGKEFYNFFKKCAFDTTGLSKDGDRIIIFKIYNPHFQVDIVN